MLRIIVGPCPTEPMPDSGSTVGTQAVVLYWRALVFRKSGIHSTANLFQLVALSKRQPGSRGGCTCGEGVESHHVSLRSYQSCLICNLLLVQRTVSKNHERASLEALPAGTGQQSDWAED